jgi:hypothetical protein
MPNNSWFCNQQLLKCANVNNKSNEQLMLKSYTTCTSKEDNGKLQRQPQQSVQRNTYIQKQQHCPSIMQSLAVPEHELEASATAACERTVMQTCRSKVADVRAS